MKFQVLIVILSILTIQCREGIRSAAGQGKDAILFCPWQSNNRSKEDIKAIRHLFASVLLENGKKVHFWEEGYGECENAPIPSRITGFLTEKEEASGEKSYFFSVWWNLPPRQINAIYWSKKEPYANQRIWVEIAEDLLERERFPK